MRHLVLSAVLAAFAPGAAAQEARVGHEALPGSARPTHYALEIAPDMAAMTFSGKAEIDLELAEATNEIVLNAADLTLESAALTDQPGTPAISYDRKAERVSLVFAAAIPAGPHHLSLGFKGKIYETSSGLFATPYRQDGATKTMLTTQFEPGDARRMAPLWDEPAVKTVYELSMVVPDGQDAISNTPAVMDEALGGGLRRVRFAPTPKMSSYLLFLGMGETTRITAKAGEVEIGVITRRGDEMRGQFALEITAPLLAYYNDYFGVAYPLPKLDHLAVPGSGGFGAMENWGAILYFENALLVDPALTTEASRQSIFGTIAHEMAHQWFGDLVTMSWWDDLWLNEGFASWMQKKAAEHEHPEWDVWLQSITSQQEAMELDGHASTHPVVQPVATVVDAQTAFDDITYDKGQAVIRMLEAYLGADAFREGVRGYMKAHAYGNTVTEDLWTALQAASDTPVLDIARDFTKQPGIPMLVVDSVTCTDGQSVVELHQDRFAMDASAEAKLRWRVPVVAKAVDGGAEVRQVVDGKATLTITGCGPVKLNVGNTGYFRTLYARPLFDALAAAFPRLDKADQMGLLADTWALAAAGYQPMPDYMSLTTAVAEAADPMVWQSLAVTFKQVADLYRGEEGGDVFAAYARGRLSPALAKIGWEPSASERPNVGIERDALIEALARLGDKGVQAEAARRFAAFQQDPNSLAGGIRRAVTRAVAMHADAAMWETLRQLAASAASPLEQRFYLEALTFVLDEQLAARTLDLAISPAVPKQYGPRMIQGLARRHPDLAWAFIRSHQDAIFERVDQMARYSFIPEIAQMSSHPERAKELETYFKQTLPDGPDAEMKRAIDKILSSGAIRTKRLPEINDWLGRTQ